MLLALFSVLGIVNLIYLVVFIKDLIAHKNEILQEPASTIWTPVVQVFIYFLSTFGISDFAVSTAIYTRAKWVSIKKLPGTLNAQDVIPIFAMAVTYITSVKIDFLTLAVCMIGQALGAVIGPHIVIRMKEAVIRRFVEAGLLVATIMIVLSKFNVIQANGTAMGLHGWKLIFAGFALFVFGALNNIGIGCFSLTMATVYLLGLNPIAAFPIMMGGCALALPLGAMQFIRAGRYSRKITLSSVFGIIGVLIAVFVVKSMNMGTIQWIVIGVLIYTCYTLITSERKIEKLEKANN